MDDQAGVVCGVGQLAHNALGELGFIWVEHAGADAYPHLFAVRALGAQLLAGAGGVAGHRFAQLLGVVSALAEGAAASDLLLGSIPSSNLARNGQCGIERLT